MMAPKTLVTVYGKHKGVVLGQGRRKPDQDDLIPIEYMHADNGMRVVALIPSRDVQERTAGATNDQR